MLDHIPFNPTALQRAHLERLAAHLDLGVTNLQFDMENYQSYCGTVGCACGHGPSLGIVKMPSESWDPYADRAFGAADVQAFTWMFSAIWATNKTDNTPRGAAARIRYALRHGIPANYNDQVWGRAPLSYTVPDRVDPPLSVSARGKPAFTA